jgi:GntR family transcriptional repressor for pyruvate dehydrogenase complex
MSDFTPIPNLTKYQEIIKKIQTLIKEREFLPGDRLPPERLLCKMFEVNRSSLREAVRILSTLRILEAKVGSGVYVRDPNLDASFEMLYLQNDLGMAINKDEIRESLEIRYVLEMYSVRRICLRRDDLELSPLLEILEDHKNLGEDGANSEQLDRKFHLELARTSGNQLLVRLLNSLYNMSMTRRKHYFMDEARRRKSFEDHMSIIEALKTRDLSQAEAIMALHLKRASQLWGYDNNDDNGGKSIDFN